MLHIDSFIEVSFSRGVFSGFVSYSSLWLLRLFLSFLFYKDNFLPLLHTHTHNVLVALIVKYVKVEE